MFSAGGVFSAEEVALGVGAGSAAKATLASPGPAAMEAVISPINTAVMVGRRD
ncbi:hypothetical protein [Pseudarthrobacter oxydans]|uniref:hypothetical protein n=1 Tax=Pseudarthrobacter oxydans TaxID=1671 RepID=UPI00343099F8